MKLWVIVGLQVYLATLLTIDPKDPTRFHVKWDTRGDKGYVEKKDCEPFDLDEIVVEKVIPTRKSKRGVSEILNLPKGVSSISVDGGVRTMDKSDADTSSSSSSSRTSTAGLRE